jgi:hypothetical protein
MPGPKRLAAVLAAALTLLSASAHGAPRVLDLPLYEPSRGLTQVPAYDARKFVLELREDAPRLAAPAPALLKGARAETEAALYQVHPLRPDRRAPPAAP